MVSLRCRKLSIPEIIAMLENSAWCARGAGARLFGSHQRSDPRLLQRNDPLPSPSSLLRLGRGTLRRGPPNQRQCAGAGFPSDELLPYRIAKVKSADQVALEADNSPAIIFKHYRELTTEEQADKWFGILPKPGQWETTFSYNRLTRKVTLPEADGR